MLGGLAGLAVFGLRAADPAAAAPRLGADPFRLGIASGDPLPDSVVLWTRLAPWPLVPGGGMPNREVAVQWQVASDERMRQVVRQGTALASLRLAHSVHVEVDGLQPGREYFYAFKVGHEYSPIGRTRTADNASPFL